jgi:hypothetical protein
MPQSPSPSPKQWTQEELQAYAAEQERLKKKKLDEGTVSKVLPGSKPQYSGGTVEEAVEAKRVKASEAAASASKSTPKVDALAAAAAEAKKQREALKGKEKQ